MKWYEVHVLEKYDVEMPRGGIKEKKIRHRVLVEAELVSEAEQRALQMYIGNPNEIEIIVVKESKIIDVLREGESP